MTTEFSEYQPDDNAPVQVYASTNPYMRHALKLFDITFLRNPDNAPNKKASDIPQGDIAFGFDSLMPIALKDLRYLPAEKIMKVWANKFFGFQSHGGLISIDAGYSVRRKLLWEHIFSDPPSNLVPHTLNIGFRQTLNDGIVSQDLFNDLVEKGFIKVPDLLNPPRTIVEKFNGDSESWRINVYYFDINYIDSTLIIFPNPNPEVNALEIYVEWGGRPTENPDSSYLIGHYYGAAEIRDTSAVKSLFTMKPFLDWLGSGFILDPLDPNQLGNSRTLQEACIKWADAFKQPNDSTHHGHFSGGVLGYTLYNYVHTGLQDKEMLPADRSNFEKMFRFSLEGLPDSIYVRTHDYGVVAVAFERLTEITGLDIYAGFARQINEGLWNARPYFAKQINKCKPDEEPEFDEIYLMASDYTRFGPVLGDFGSGMTSAQKYQAGTDAIYWGYNMFEAYRLADNGRIRHDLKPPRGIRRQIVEALGRLADPFDRFLNLRRLIEPWLFQDDITQRKTRLKTLGLLDDNAFPDKYLGMALGLTLDWIRYGWRPEFKHFVNRLSYDGCWHNNEIGSDSKYNTLSMLVYAYEFTHDEFYMDIFDKAWGKYRELAEDPGTGLGGFFPERIVEGNVNQEWVLRDPSQSFFLDILIRAWKATVDAGRPRENYLVDARDFANLIISHADGDRAEGMPFLRLALASGTLRRIHFTVWEDVEALVIIDSDQGSFTIKRNNDSVFREAVIYMNAGRYRVNYRRQDDTASESWEFEVGGMTTSVHIDNDGLEIGEEGFA